MWSFVIAVLILLPLVPNLPVASAQDVGQRVRSADALYGQRRFREAVEILDAVLAGSPDYGPAIFLRGQCRYALLRYRDARTDLERALALGAPADDCVEMLAHLAYYYGDYDEARRLIDRVQSPPEYVHWLRRVIDGPFRGRWGRAADKLEGRSSRGHYSICTDIGVTEQDMDACAEQVRVQEARGAAGERVIGRLVQKTQGFRQVDAWMEEIYKLYGTVFDIQRDESIVYRVVILNARDDFLRFASIITSGDQSDYAGFYSPDLKALVLFNDVDGRKQDRLLPEAQNTMFHEGFHQFLHAYLVGVPRWFDEGLAGYFGPAQVSTAGKIRIGIVEKSVQGRRTDYQIIRAALDPNATVRPTPLRELLLMDARGFEAPGREGLHYAQSWAFVHFLMSSPKGKDILRDYFRALQSGADAARAYEEVFGRLDIEALDAGWRRYVQGL